MTKIGVMCEDRNANGTKERSLEETEGVQDEEREEREERINFIYYAL